MLQTLLRGLALRRKEAARPRKPAAEWRRPRVEELESRIVPAPLVPGAPVIVVPPTPFSAVGTADVTSTIASFKTAMGGADNAGVTAPQLNGFRTINWDGVNLTGSDFGGGPNTVVISPGNTVGIPLNRFQTRGVFFEAVYAVSGDGFKSVNANAGTTLLPAFSPKNTFAMFNTNDIDFQFMLPSPNGSTPVPAAARGFGAIFTNVELDNSTSIELFHGTQSLGKFFAPKGAQGQPEFIGALFNSPIVTSVTLTLGTEAIFNFDGTTISGTSTDDPATGHNLVVTDDWFYPEPVPSVDMPPVLSGRQGTLDARPLFTATPDTAFSGVVATFTDRTGTGNAKAYTATINWGDGHISNGTVAATASPLGFTVSGSNTYHNPGLVPISVDISDFDDNTVTVTNTARVGTPNQIWLAQIYKDLLGRELDAAGLAFWGNLLNSGQTRAQVVLGIEQSTEFINVEVQGLFQHYLRHAATPAGFQFYGDLLRSGKTLEDATAILVGSQEYFQNRGGGTTSGALAALYQDALGRPIDSAGQQFYTQLLASNGNNFAAAAAVLLGSLEYRTRITNVLLTNLLRHAPTPAAVTFHVGVYNNGVVNGVDPFRQIIALITNSQEYFDLVQRNDVLLLDLPQDPFKPNPV
jgi:hypothetical protein